ncbi:hypothetical protein K438DRAFT_1754216 [Mycena galopus ATCC 62051]|nr:hypothetical protein K438DRAFT_1754216 [Mycena galopus ATCC 62051]
MKTHVKDSDLARDGQNNPVGIEYGEPHDIPPTQGYRSPVAPAITFPASAPIVQASAKVPVPEPAKVRGQLVQDAVNFLPRLGRGRTDGFQDAAGFRILDHGVISTSSSPVDHRSTMGLLGETLFAEQFGGWCRGLGKNDFAANDEQQIPSRLPHPDILEFDGQGRSLNRGQYGTTKARQRNERLVPEERQAIWPLIGNLSHTFSSWFQRAMNCKTEDRS